jgi:periplasmic mercuric ion binding protein
MKSRRLIVAAILAVFACTILFAQTQPNPKKAKTRVETIKVQGNCEMCKSRIEKAAKITGVSSAIWNKDSKMMSVAYDPVLATIENIQKSIAASGHDTEKFPASDKAYKSLPGCCQYERK